MEDKILGLIPSDEQRAFINAVTRGENILTLAVAGASKSTSAYMAIKLNPNRTFLILSFMNKLSKETNKEIKKHNINNAECRTIHSLAFQHVVKGKEVELINFIDYGEVVKLLKINFGQVKDVLEEFNDWVSSDETYEEATFETQEIYNMLVLTGRHTHSTYLKVFQLGCAAGKINLEYDAIVLDEVNDANATMTSIVKHFKGQRIVIGDRHQSIMGFSLRGYSAFDDKEFLATVPNEYKLSTSFRCDPNIATFVQKFGRIWFNEEFTFKGFNSSTDTTTAMLSRTNAGSIPLMVELAKKGKKFSTVKDIDEVFAEIYNALKVFKFLGSVSSTVTAREVRDNGITNSKDVADCVLFSNMRYSSGSDRTHITVKDFVSGYMRNEVNVGMTIANKYNDLERLKETIKTHIHEDSSISVSTAHVSKGLTFNSVFISDFTDAGEMLFDLIKLVKLNYTGRLITQLTMDDLDGLIRSTRTNTRKEYRAVREELNLLYVAITRCKHNCSLVGIDVNQLINKKALLRNVNTLIEEQNRMML